MCFEFKNMVSSYMFPSHHLQSLRKALTAVTKPLPFVFCLRKNKATTVIILPTSPTPLSHYCRGPHPQSGPPDSLWPFLRRVSPRHVDTTRSSHDKKNEAEKLDFSIPLNVLFSHDTTPKQFKKKTKQRSSTCSIPLNVSFFRQRESSCTVKASWQIGSPSANSWRWFQ